MDNSPNQRLSYSVKESALANESVISHALVLPDHNFYEWYAVLRPYLDKFERVAVLRSPGGNDLNHYRDITAVQAPLTWWQDSALTHIRRVYPSVVMVDVIDVDTPAELEPILQRRIQRDDRFGQQEATKHIYFRFILEWPTSARPMAVLRRFNADPEHGELNPSIDLLTQENADVLCGAPGTVIALGDSIQVESIIEGERFITTYGGLRDSQVSIGDQVTLSQVLAKATGDRLRIIVQNPPDKGSNLLGLANVMNPRDYIYIPQFRARSQIDNLRLRQLPSSFARIIGMVHSWHLLEPREHHGRAIEKIGSRNSWLKVRAPSGAEGYCAAWYLGATTQAEAKEAFHNINPVGVNLDIFHPRGKPAPSRLGQLGWLRLGYNVSNARGSEDINAALQRYLPHVEAWRAAGYRIIFATSHQTYGEGKSEFWPWSQMTAAKWHRLIKRFANMMRQIAEQWAGRDLVAAWQIWNEPDSTSLVASVPMPAEIYAELFEQASRAIRSVDSEAKIITAGFNSGPRAGSAYARRMLERLPADVALDGLAFHPYGRGVNGHPHYALFGHIDESVWAYSAVLPDKPLWITEFGVLDHPEDDPAQVANYATSFINYLKTQYPGKIAAMIWYAWAEGMHNGYGLVDRAGNPRPPLTNRFLSA